MKLLGYKCGMSQYRLEKKVFPVTLLYVPDNVITQLKTCSVQHAIPSLSSNKAIRTKSLRTHLSKSGVTQKSHIAESRVTTSQISSLKVGDVIVAAEKFLLHHHLDISAKTKGKGFQGPVKRWGFSMQPASHGTSLTHRAHGSTGGCQTPGRVFKGKKMAGQMGGKQATVQNLLVLDIDPQQKTIAVKGCVPGPNGTLVRLSNAVKKTKCN